MIKMELIDEKPITLEVINDELIDFELIGTDFDNIPKYTGTYVVEPRFVSQELLTANKMMEQNVLIEAIEVARTSNPAGGKTVYIGGIING